MKRIISTVILFTLALALTSCGIRQSELPGQMVMRNGQESMKGICIYTPSTNTYETLLEDSYFLGAEFNKERSKILLIKTVPNPSKDDYIIFEYDMQTTELKPIVKADRMLMNSFSYFLIRYVPSSNKVSYIRNNKLYIFDMDLNVETFITNIDGYWYSWHYSGEYFVYSKDFKTISKFYVKTKEIEPMFEGKFPELSDDGKYMTYSSSTGYKIREMNTGQILGPWGIVIPCRFSPDSNYVVIGEMINSIIGPTDYGNISVINIHTGAKKTLLKKFRGSNIDWG